jgi:hypothetical protein
MKINIPEGVSGNWKVERFTISESASEMSLFSYKARRPDPGTYTKLTRGGHVIMSDTPAELRDLMPLEWNAKGHVLINGLGLGVALAICLKKAEVTRVTVIEKSEDVIFLVGTHFKDNPNVEIIHADAFEWKPPKGVRYGAVWNDIWDDICADNLPEMHKLHRKYGKRSDWQGSWCRGECERSARQERHSVW